MPRSKGLIDDLFEIGSILADRLYDSWDRKRNVKNTRTIEDIHKLSWYQFEHLVLEAFRLKGYKVAHRGGMGDGGIDLMLRGPDGSRHAVQCKQFRTWKVGGPKMREFVGAVQIEKDVASGIYVTCGEYTEQAKDVAKRANIELIDGRKLLEMLRDVQTPAPAPSSDPSSAAEEDVASAAVPDSVVTEAPSCPKCGSAMVLRTAKRGANAGGQFYGCSAFPNCRGVLGTE